jgi:phage tail sheath protein FI
MPRLSYAAPGVYVEEVPSARQPIAGVGTNTVAFIGLVPDVVYIPRASSRYNPVEAAKAAAGRSLAAAGAARLGGGALPDIAALEARVRTATEDEARKRTALDEATAKRQAAAAGADTAPLDKAVTKAQGEHERALAAKTEAEKALAQARSALLNAAGAQGEAEDLTYENTVPDAAFVLTDPKPENHPVDRPYYFEEFRVRPAEFATKLCTNFSEYAAQFGDFSGFTPGADTDDPSSPLRFKPLSPGHHMLTHAVNGFFKNGGTRCFVARVKSEAGLKKALERFESIDEVAILAAPGLPKSKANWEQLLGYCEHQDHTNVFGIIDSPAVLGTGREFDIEKLKPGAEGMPRESKYAAAYFPYIEVSDPAKRLQDEDPARGIAPKYRGLTYVPPSGHMAGLYARTDEERGVHKAPANAVVRGALEVKYYVSKAHQEILNPLGVNCLRIMGGAVIPWGARTIGGDRNGEWKYINVRRFAGFLMESIDEGTQWVVFEPNDPALWSKIRLNVTAFLTNVWRNGALFGLTPEEAFFVKCDEELNPPEVRDLGQVITEIGVSIVRPAEFVIFRISQSTGPNKG